MSEEDYENEPGFIGGDDLTVAKLRINQLEEENEVLKTKNEFLTAQDGMKSHELCSQFAGAYAKDLRAKKKKCAVLSEELETLKNTHYKIIGEILKAEDTELLDKVNKLVHGEVANITRVEIIGSNGREFSETNLQNAEVSYQDDGRTLKIFIKEK